MKKIGTLLLVAILGGVFTLSAYKLFFKENKYIVNQTSEKTNFLPTNFNVNPNAATENINFTIAAENTVNAVVHVKNVTVNKRPASIFEYYYGHGGKEKFEIGTGSGVIISPDGYIVTNNHVIANASELQVTLNNNKNYNAELIGRDAATDIALLKIDVDEPLPFLAFGNSDDTKIGEWVLAVGNPFNLTSTVTAGIISAKARDLNEFDGKNQSFIQTDAAINPGNSGGALVNTNGNLIGINTAISSQTGSYVGYSFAVPSNIVRKVVEDIMEYGNVQKGILGISTIQRNSELAIEKGINEIEGVYINSIEEDSGAKEAGLQEGDIIKKIDDVKIQKFADLTGYLSSKRPDDVVNVNILRGNKTKNIPVKLYKNQMYVISKLGVEVKNLSKTDKKKFDTKKGVKITRTSQYMNRYNLEGKVLIAVNDQKIDDIDDAKQFIDNADYQPTSIVILNEGGEKERFIFQ